MADPLGEKQLGIDGTASTDDASSSQRLSKDPPGETKSTGVKPLVEQSRRIDSQLAKLPRFRKRNPLEILDIEGSQSNHRKLDHSPDVSVDEVMTYAQEYLKVTFGGYEQQDLPKYDDVTGYGLSDEHQIRLWKLEVERLVKGIQSYEPILFDSKGVLQTVTTEELTNLSHIADQISCNLATIVHDNILLDEPDEYERPSRPLYKTAKAILETRLKDDIIVDETDDETVDRPPRILEKNNNELYCMVVDYSTAVLGRFLYRCAASQVWYNVTLSILATWSTKLKILLKDPCKYACASLEAAEDIDEERSSRRLMDFFDSNPRRAWAENQKNTRPLEELYHVRQRCYRFYLHRLFLHLLSATFYPKSLMKKDCTAFEQASELCSRVYRNGQDISHTAISHNKDGEFSATSDPQEMRYVRSAFDILLVNTRYIRKNPKLPPNVDWHPISVQWKWNQREADVRERPPELHHNPDGGTISLTKIDDIISIMAPYALCDAQASSAVKSMLYVVKSYVTWHGHQIDDYKPEDFAAEFSIAFPNRSSVDHRQKKESFGSSLKDATVLGERVLPGASLKQSVLKKAPTAAAIERFESQLNKMADWKFDERSVLVRCRRVVWPVIGISLLVVVGGAILPFLNRVRFTNVDPSNLSTYTWILVAFFLLLFQSIYVPHWTWHDFIRARVRCHTLSELASVTGLDAQIILYKLLSMEQTTVLSTRGPHNSMFRRQDYDGFSVDVPAMTSTLYASGFVLLVCMGEYERHIVCLDARPVTEIKIASHQSSGTELGCAYPPQSPNDNTEPYILRLVKREYSRYHVGGLFLVERQFG